MTKILTCYGSQQRLSTNFPSWWARVLRHLINVYTGIFAFFFWACLNMFLPKKSEYLIPDMHHVASSLLNAQNLTMTCSNHTNPQYSCSYSIYMWRPSSFISSTWMNRSSFRFIDLMTQKSVKITTWMNGVETNIWTMRRRAWPSG